jgi:hypothetical protein
MHLLTTEAFADYRRLLSPGGLLMVHISNRYIDLDPVIAAAAAGGGWHAALRRYRPSPQAMARNEGASDWVAMSQSPETLRKVIQGSGAQWTPLAAPARFKAWTDDHSSVLPLISWAGKKS